MYLVCTTLVIYSNIPTTVIEGSRCKCKLYMFCIALLPYNIGQFHSSSLLLTPKWNIFLSTCFVVKAQCCMQKLLFLLISFHVHTQYSAFLSTLYVFLQL